jgi:hypothetical protein
MQKLLSILFVLSTCNAAVTYSYQDGALTDTVSLSGIGPGDAWWANQFYTSVGGEAIDTITLGFGPNLANTTVNFLLYDDPNGNGLPDDLALLSNTPVALGAYAPAPGAVSTFLTFTLPAPVQVGSSFFAAMLLSNASATADARADRTAPHGRSWFAGNETPNTLDPANLGAADLPPTNLVALGANVDLMISATGLPGSPVPEPSSFVLAAAALLMLRKRLE